MLGLRDHIQSVGTQRFTGPVNRAAFIKLSVLLIFLVAIQGRSQRIDPSMTPPLQETPEAQQERNLENLPSVDLEARARQLRALNALRQKAMVSDAAKLVKMTKELNDEIARTNPEAFTNDQLKEIAAIEKLARNVKEAMSTAVNENTGFIPSFSPQNR